MKYLISVLVLVISEISLAQNADDILRYSYHNSYTTARSAGIGGAFSALGADLSSLTSNPAGLGLYRRGDFSFTPNLGGSTSNTNFNGSDTRDSDFHLKINSIGFVTTQDSEKPNISKVSFGLAYNRAANFNQNFTVEGFNSNSLLDVFANSAEGLDYRDIYDLGTAAEILAWDAFLIDTIPGMVSQYATPIGNAGADHTVSVERNGGMGEMVIGGGVNVRDRLYWGVSIGFPVVRFGQEVTHTESPKDETSPLSSFTYTENLEVTGGGVNLKVGAILKATKKLRIGAAYHTRTTLSLSETFSQDITSNFQGDELDPELFISSFDYRIVIPSKLMINGAFIAGKSALISADYEFTNYASGKLRRSPLATDPYDFEEENNEASDLYRPTHNVRVGMEFRLADIYRLRAGSRYMQSPFDGDAGGQEASAPVIIYTLGAGIRKGSFYADIAGMYSQRSTGHFIYRPELVNQSQVQTNRINFLLTLGLRI